MKCYYHIEFENKEIELGDKTFCNEEEHEKWADKHYGKKIESKPKEIEDMQNRLLEFAKEERLKSGKGLFE